MQRLIAAGECPIEDLDLVNDDLMKWRFKIRSFDDTSQGKRQRSGWAHMLRPSAAPHLVYAPEAWSSAEHKSAAGVAGICYGSVSTLSPGLQFTLPTSSRSRHSTSI